MSREGFCRNPRGIFRTKSWVNFSVDCLGLFLGDKAQEKKSTSKSTAKSTPEFGSFAAKSTLQGSGLEKMLEVYSDTSWIKSSIYLSLWRHIYRAPQRQGNRIESGARRCHTSMRTSTGSGDRPLWCPWGCLPLKTRLLLSHALKKRNDFARLK